MLQESGRSLGVHLILATQKPAGIVNDQIRSNSKFAICLKVQDREDSFDVIKRPDAANLRNAGQFYMQFGNDEYFTLGQSAWAGAKYLPAESNKQKEDTSIEFISNIGTLIKRADDSVQKVENAQGEQLTNIVEYICKLAKQEQIITNGLWLESIPDTIYIKDLREKYDIVEEENNIAPVIGEYDDPQTQSQGIVKLKITNGGNALIYGNADSGKETLLSTVVYDTITTYSSDDVWLYLLDFGSEALKIFKGCPHVGDVAFMSDSEKIDRFFRMIQDEIKNRKAILSDYNGDYDLYVKTSGNKMPAITVIINNYESFSEYYQDKYDDILLTITREGIRFGINFIMTISTYTDVRYRLAQNFKQKISLQLNNEDDYMNIFDKVGKKKPSNIFGRGLVSIDDEVYEFQTAKICEAEEWSNHIRETIQKLKESNETIANPIPIMPNRITFQDVEHAFKDITTVPLGISKQELKITTYNFTKNFINIITSKNIDDAVQLTINILEEIKRLENINVKVLDGEKIIRVKKGDLKEDYEQFIQGLNETSDQNTICIIIGIDKFIGELDRAETELYEMLLKAENLENYNFIIVDTSSKLKNHEYDEWYKVYISGEDGIWIGSGVDDQYLIRAATSGKNIVNNCGPSFGYVIKQSEVTMIKLLGSKEEGDENE